MKIKSQLVSMGFDPDIIVEDVGRYISICMPIVVEGKNYPNKTKEILIKKSKDVENDNILINLDTINPHDFMDALYVKHLNIILGNYVAIKNILS